MEIDLAGTKQEFTRLMDEEFGSERILDLLLQVKESESLSPDDAGWALWNICDRYALLRDAITQHRYQSEFLDLVKYNFPERAHWVVSDGTQACTQVNGGFLDFWSKSYQFANDTAPRVAENRGARFEAHRANAVSYIKFDEIGYAESALEALAELLEEDPQWPSQSFASVTCKTLLMDFYSRTGNTNKVAETEAELERTLDEWHQQMQDVKVVEFKDQPLFGSWESFAVDWPPANGFAVGLNCAACAMACARRFSTAERLFRKWMEYRGKELQDYGQALFILSCWHNRHERNEIISMLCESRNIAAGYLIEVAPEMADVVNEQPRSANQNWRTFKS